MRSIRWSRSAGGLLAAARRLPRPGKKPREDVRVGAGRNRGLATLHDHRVTGHTRRSVRRDESFDQFCDGATLVSGVGAASAEPACSPGRSVVEHVAVAHRVDHHMRRTRWRRSREVFVVHRTGAQRCPRPAPTTSVLAEPCRLGRRRQRGRVSCTVDRIDDDDPVGIDPFGDPPGDLATAGVTGEPHLVGTAGGHDVLDDPDSPSGLVARRRVAGERARTSAVHLGRHDRRAIRDDRGEQRPVAPRRQHESGEEHDHPCDGFSRSPRVDPKRPDRAGKVRAACEHGVGGAHLATVVGPTSGRRSGTAGGDGMFLTFASLSESRRGEMVKVRGRSEGSTSW
jgi:hypothetical protein